MVTTPLAITEICYFKQISAFFPLCFFLFQLYPLPPALAPPARAALPALLPDGVGGAALRQAGEAGRVRSLRTTEENKEESRAQAPDQGLLPRERQEARQEEEGHCQAEGINFLKENNNEDDFPGRELNLDKFDVEGTKVVFFCDAWRVGDTLAPFSPRIIMRGFLNDLIAILCLAAGLVRIGALRSPKFFRESGVVANLFEFPLPSGRSRGGQVLGEGPQGPQERRGPAPAQEVQEQPGKKRNTISLKNNKNKKRIPSFFPMQYFLAPDDPTQYCKEKCVETK